MQNISDNDDGDADCDNGNLNDNVDDNLKFPTALKGAISLLFPLTRKHAKTIYVYVCIYVYICVCICICIEQSMTPSNWQARSENQQASHLFLAYKNRYRGTSFSCLHTTCVIAYQKRLFIAQRLTKCRHGGATRRHATSRKWRRREPGTLWTWGLWERGGAGPPLRAPVPWDKVPWDSVPWLSPARVLTKRELPCPAGA